MTNKCLVKWIISSMLLFVGLTGNARLQPVYDLAERVTEGTSRGKIEFKLIENCGDDSIDCYKISSTDDGKVLIEGNSPVSIAVGLNYYLKYVAGIHISWNNLTQKLPDKIVLPEKEISGKTDLLNRYYLNYCTFSYSMPFWDEDRWMKEIDWMALHGVNMALSLTGSEVVWKNLLEKLGYDYQEICDFIPGPAYMAWWQMNNLEGWGGPLPPAWFERQKNLQKKIVARMDSLGIKPILPGYSGMVPSTFKEKTGIATTNTGKWCGFDRPHFISPTDKSFDEIADLYYEELRGLYGKAAYYAMDPFHEGGNAGDIDLALAGDKLYQAMKRNNPHAKWVIQSWQGNPRKQMIDTIPPGDLIILDLYSEKIPKWEKIDGYGEHDWIYCMLLNFGGNIGMHGRMDSLSEGLERARNGKYGKTLAGVGATPEGIENNPVMYEYLFELPWIDDSVDTERWLSRYLEARYGRRADTNIIDAWNALYHTVYNAPQDYPGEGTVESLICARPSWNPRSVSTWGNSTLFYSPDSTAKAANLLKEVYDSYSDNPNFVYDFVDITRQANADEANRLIREMSELKERGQMDSVGILSGQFLDLLLSQDSLLSLLPDTRVGTWIDAAATAAGDDPDAIKLFKKNAAMLVTVWGDSVAANQGGLHDYSHREWGGLIKELYYPRWKAFFDHELYGAPTPDFYKMERDWVSRRSED